MGACHLLSVPVVTVVLHALAFATLLLEMVFHFFFTTFSDRCLGSNNDEGRSEV